MSPTVYTTSQPLLHKRSVGTAETPACPSAPSSSPYHRAGYSSPLCRQVTKPTQNCLFSSSTEQTQTMHKPPSSSAGQTKLSSANLAPLAGLQPSSAQGKWRIPAAFSSESELFAEQMETGVPWLVKEVPSVHVVWEVVPNQLLMLGNTELSATKSCSQQQICAVMAWEHPT